MPRSGARPALDARRIDLLEQIDREGTISAAADALNFTGSAVSQQLRQLETEMGVELVSRGARTAALTAAGRVLLEHGIELRDRIEAAEHDLRQVASLSRGTLRLGSFRSAGETLCADAISYFKAHWPAIDVTLVEGEPDEFAPLVRRGALDLILVFDYDEVPTSFDGRLEFSLLCEDEMMLVLPVEHPFAGREQVSLSDLVDEAWIVSTERCSVASFTERACRRAGFEPRTAIATDDYRIAQALVAHGGGVTFLPRLAARSLHPGCRAQRIADVPLGRRLYAGHRIGGKASPAVAQMLAVLTEVAVDVDH